MKTRWIWVLGKRNITIGAREFKISDRWDEFIASITAYPWLPPLLGRSEFAPVVHNEDTAPEWGRVVEWRVLSRDEAQVAQTDDYALYARIEQWDGPSFTSVSPSLHFDFQDESGTVWPCVIQHVAVCTVPLQQLGQPSQRDLETLAMSRMEAVMADKIDVDAEVVEDIDETTDDVEETVDEAADLIAELKAQIADLQSQIEELKGGSASDDDDEDKDSETVDMSRRLAALEAHVFRTEVEGAAKALGLSRKHALAIRRKLGDDEWAALVGTGAARSKNETRMSRGYSNTRGRKPMSREELDRAAVAYQKKHGGSYIDALNAVKEG